jgi:type II secretory pathway pseudopilin PulG
VLAFVVGLGAAITAVVTALSMATDISSDNRTKLTVIISAVIITLLSVLLFARIVRPARFGFLTRKFRLIVTVITVIGIIAALAGPYLASINSKTDRLIEQNLPSVSQAVQMYVSNNQKLPGSLKNVTFGDYEKGAKTLVDRDLVSYRKLDKTAPVTANTSKGSGVSLIAPDSGKSYSYELCVTYKHAKNSNNSRITPAVDQYSTYIDTYSHKAGKVCYTQYAYNYGIYPADVKASSTM